MSRKTGNDLIGHKHPGFGYNIHESTHAHTMSGTGEWLPFLDKY